MLLRHFCLTFAVFGGKLDFSDEIVMNVDALDAISGGFVRLVDNDLIYYK